jgi:hypothetical protein
MQSFADALQIPAMPQYLPMQTADNRHRHGTKMHMVPESKTMGEMWRIQSHYSE